MLPHYHFSWAEGAGVAPGRDPDNIGELWQFISGELKLLRLQLESSDRVATSAIQRLVESVKTQDARLDILDRFVERHEPLQDRVKDTETEIEKLKEKQTQAIAGGSVLLFLASVAWPVVKGWLRI